MTGFGLVRPFPGLWDSFRVNTATFLLLREAFYGVQRFTDMHANLGIARNILSNRLSRLVDKGIMERQPGPGSLPAQYRLTAKGRDLYPVALALMQWADQWVVERPTARPAHRDCGGAIEGRGPVQSMRHDTCRARCHLSGSYVLTARPVTR